MFDHVFSFIRPALNIFYEIWMKTHKNKTATFSFYGATQE